MRMCLANMVNEMFTTALIDDKYDDDDDDVCVM